MIKRSSSVFINSSSSSLLVVEAEGRIFPGGFGDGSGDARQSRSMTRVRRKGGDVR